MGYVSEDTWAEWQGGSSRHSEHSVCGEAKTCHNVYAENTLKWKLYLTWEHVSAEHRICVMSKAQGVNIQIWLSWRDGVKRDRDFDVHISEGKQLQRNNKKSKTVMWCQSAGIIYKGDKQREPEGKTVIWWGSLNITDVLLVWDWICSSVWGQSNK